jgi:hypothetical protein
MLPQPSKTWRFNISEGFIILPWFKKIVRENIKLDRLDTNRGAICSWL